MKRIVDFISGSRSAISAFAAVAVVAAACFFIACYDDNFLDSKEPPVGAVNVFIPVAASCLPAVFLRLFSPNTFKLAVLDENILSRAPPLSVSHC